MKFILVFCLAMSSMVSVQAGEIAAGGISGGGGGTIVPNPAGATYVELQLSGARTSLLMMFKKLSNLKLEALKHPRLFQDKDNILDKVKNYSLSIQMEKPCYDFDGKESDGSINSEPNTICMSAFTIGQKVSMITAYPQLLALMAHEYSHLMGYDEAEARDFQEKILYTAKSVEEGDAFSLASHFTMEAFATGTYLNQTAVWLVRKQSAKAYGTIKQANQTSLFLDKYPMQALDNAETKTAVAISIRIKNLQLALCIQNETDPDVRSSCQSYYDIIFDDKDVVSLNDFHWSYYGNMEETFPGNVPNLLKNPDQYMPELTAVETDVEALRATIGDQLNLRD